MLQNALRLVLATMLAICSPAWCACAFAQPKPSEPVHEQSCDDAADACCAAEDYSQCAEGDRAPHGDGCPGRGRCERACCDMPALVSAARGGTQAISIDFHPAPVPPILARIEAMSFGDDANGAGGWAAGLLGRGADWPAERSLLTQRCLLLI